MLIPHNELWIGKSIIHNNKNGAHTMSITWVIGKEVIAVSGVTRSMGRIFKDTFKSGLWDPSTKDWTISKSSVALEKLEQFRARAQRVNAASARLAETELAHEELRRLEDAIDTMAGQIEAALASLHSLEEIEAIYDRVFFEHQDLSTHLKSVVKQVNDHAKASRKRLDPILDALKIHDLISEVIEARRSRKTPSSVEKYDLARYQLKQSHELVIKTYGLDIACLSRLAALDWDAAEVDSPSNVVRQLYLDIREVKSSTIH